MIGIMTSLGANEAALRKIFIYQGVNIILKGNHKQALETYLPILVYRFQRIESCK